MINEFEYRLHDVPRWSVVRTIRKQSVAEHSFYVALIAPRVAEHMYGIEMIGSDEFLLTRYAMLHDRFEAFSADLPGMIKDCIDEQKLKERYISQLPENPVPLPWMREVVKFADLFERCHFLATELSMGNEGVRHIFEDNLKLLNIHMNKGKAAAFMSDVNTNLYKVSEGKIKTMDLRDVKS